ncbi:Gfo/Idh/MocA family oxidoreductase [Cohnella ginsengisoli]|uniref:Gfo/Idh/MocA family oxidoreductase n=1 Tax=Cohnella ginsengisoli TaxID=425004 RepID=A0A9X4QQN4_9BACL|nr:Gfo/Idh/MocA family oxidoreductase [Cohnella ginsengisoli]MDG0793910.1 Gfo/Idh/MocA family oxidoreductase [Cohnella ginsengisoli]
MQQRDIGVCIIGAGRAGMIHAANFRKNVPYARLVAIVDPNEEAAVSAAKELGIDRYYTDYKQALEDAEIDAVVVVTPTIYHRDIVVASAQAGKHVLCEKPMAMNERECDEMIAACEAAGVTLQVAFMRRFDENFVEAKRAIDEGEIGEVVLVKSLTRGPSQPMPWMYDLAKSNGPLAEVNSHDIDTIRWFSGSEVSEVYAIGGNYRNRHVAADYPDFYDNVSLTARFASGAQASIDGAVAVRYGYDSRVEILGTEGVIFLGQTHEKTTIVAGPDRLLRRPFMNSWRSLFKEAYLAEDTDFIASIQEGRPPRVTGHDGKMAVRVVEAGNASIKTGVPVRL